MTGNDVLKLAYDIMSEEENSEFTAFAPGILTVLLAETWACNNDLRRRKGLPELAEIPTVTAEIMDQQLPCETEIQLTVLPYGICEKYADGDGDTVKTGYYNSLYVNGVNNCLRGIAQENGVVDLY